MECEALDHSHLAQAGCCGHSSSTKCWRFLDQLSNCSSGGFCSWWCADSASFRVKADYSRHIQGRLPSQPSRRALPSAQCALSRCSHSQGRLPSKPSRHALPSAQCALSRCSHSKHLRQGI
jgi:hypothetical protein